MLFRSTNKILTALYAQNTLYKQITSSVEGITHPYLNIGQIEGGTNTNVIPGRVTFKLDRRMIPEENPTEVEAALRKVITDTAAQSQGVTVEIKRILLARAMQPLAGNKPLIDAIQKHGQAVFGEPIPALGKNGLAVLLNRINQRLVACQRLHGSGQQNAFDLDRQIGRAHV